MVVSKEQIKYICIMTKKFPRSRWNENRLANGKGRRAHEPASPRPSPPVHEIWRAMGHSKIFGEEDVEKR